jgi:hypothetical protein
MQDIYSAIETIGAKMSEPGVFRVSSEGRCEVDPFRLATASVRIKSQSFTGHYEGKGELAYKIANPTLFTLSQYGLTNPLAVAWELVPLSFVVDWFVSVGSFIRSIQRPMGLNFDWGYITSYIEWHADYQFMSRTGTYLSGTYENCAGTKRAFRRDQYITFPVQTPYFRGFEDIGLDKSLTLLALALR